jgi:hypothetical protein
MRDNPKRSRVNWGSLIGWLIFILVIAGGPLYNLLQRTFGGTLPRNLVPILIGGLVLLSVLVSAVRALGNSVRSRGDVRLPTDVGTPPRPPNMPMPPFAGPARAPQRPSVVPPPRDFVMPARGAPPRLPQSPRFEPVINPTILVLGIMGLLLLGGAALIVFSGGLP